MPLFWTWTVELSWLRLCCLLTQTQVCCFCARTWAIQHSKLCCVLSLSRRKSCLEVWARVSGCVFVCLPGCHALIICDFYLHSQSSRLWICEKHTKWIRSELAVLLNSCLVWIFLCFFIVKKQNLQTKSTRQKLKMKNKKLNTEALFFLSTIKHFNALKVCSTFDSSAVDAQLSKQIS